MTTNITISSLAHSQNKSHDGNTFEVTYVNTPDGSFTAYPQTPGYPLLKEGATLTVCYRTNIKNGTAYKNIYRIQTVQEVDKTDLVLERLENLTELLTQLVQQSERLYGKPPQQHLQPQHQDGLPF